MKKKTNVTIHDLARELGVSSSTVSRALKGHFSIGEKTTHSVRQLAEERGYRPNHLAVSLRKQHTTNIGVIVPQFNRPFISSLISGMEQAAREAGYSVLISQSHDSYAIEIDNAKALFGSRICGLLISLAMETQEYGHFDQFTESGIPVVFVDRTPNYEACYKVVIDNYAASFKATEHLIEQGCRRIAHLGGSLRLAMYRERRNGYVAALEKHGLPLIEDYILTGNVLSAEEGFNLSESLLSLPDPPDGIFAANDTAAVSAIQFAKSKGIIVPDELAVIGFNNDPICNIVEPCLSSISQPGMNMGRLAVAQLFKIMENDPTVQQTTVLETELVPRASSLRRGA